MFPEVCMVEVLAFSHLLPVVSMRKLMLGCALLFLQKIVIFKTGTWYFLDSYEKVQLCALAHFNAVCLAISESLRGRAIQDHIHRIGSYFCQTNWSHRKRRKKLESWNAFFIDPGLRGSAFQQQSAGLQNRTHITVCIFHYIYEFVGFIHKFKGRKAVKSLQYFGTKLHNWKMHKSQPEHLQLKRLKKNISKRNYY